MRGWLMVNFTWKSQIVVRSTGFRLYRSTQANDKPLERWWKENSHGAKIIQIRPFLAKIWCFKGLFWLAKILPFFRHMTSAHKVQFFLLNLMYKYHIFGIISKLGIFPTQWHLVHVIMKSFCDAMSCENSAIF